MPSDSSTRVALGQRIRTYRLSKGITGQKFAEMASISPAYLSEVERGRSAISGEKLARIASCLGVSLQSLIDGEPAEDDAANAVVVPAALSQAAEQLNLSYQNTLKILQANRSLVARRSRGKQDDWDVDKWKAFYERMKPFLEE